MKVLLVDRTGHRTDLHLDPVPHTLETADGVTYTCVIVLPSAWQAVFVESAAMLPARGEGEARSPRGA